MLKVPLDRFPMKMCLSHLCQLPSNNSWIHLSCSNHVYKQLSFSNFISKNRQMRRWTYCWWHKWKKNKLLKLVFIKHSRIFRTAASQQKYTIITPLVLPHKELQHSEKSSLGLLKLHTSMIAPAKKKQATSLEIKYWVWFFVHICEIGYI